VRQLYTDQDEVLFDAARPVILNGIEDIVTRPDLAGAVFLTLEAIPEERRRPEAELWASFEADRPRILGVLLDAVVEGLKRLSASSMARVRRRSRSGRPASAWPRRVRKKHARRSIAPTRWRLAWPSPARSCWSSSATPRR
jgi:hypothetical protein